MDLTLNIYKADNKNEVEKTYVTNSYDLMLGTVEDIMNVIDFDKIDNNLEVAKMIIGCMKQLKPFLLDVFEGLTDEELKRVKVKELIPLFVNICNAIVDDLGLLNTGKN